MRNSERNGNRRSENKLFSIKEWKDERMKGKKQNIYVCDARSRDRIRE